MNENIKNNLNNLIFKISSGDNKALEDLYDQMRGCVFAYIYSVCGNFHMAEDVLQDTFIKIKINASSYKNFKNPKAWIFTIAKNTALNKLRYENRSESVESIDSSETIDFNRESDYTEMSDNRLLLEDAFKILNETEKQVVSLHAISDMKHSDIAVMMNKPYGTVLWTYHNAVKKLKNHINKL